MIIFITSVYFFEEGPRGTNSPLFHRNSTSEYTMTKILSTDRFYMVDVTLVYYTLLNRNFEDVSMSQKLKHLEV